MDFADWEPVYRAICEDMGYPRDGDRQARDDLAELVEEPFDPDRLGSPSTVAVAAPGPNLEADLDQRVRSADLVVAASTAADRIRAFDRAVAGEDGGSRDDRTDPGGRSDPDGPDAADGSTEPGDPGESNGPVGVDLQVTDLDKTPETTVALTREDIPVAVHAHGDNRPALRETVPDCARDWLIPTTQAAPAGRVRNFGGFTDGDRAAFLADHLGADSLLFPGWEFDDPSVGAEKRRKLRWAERLLYWLERRRGDRFGVLDGRRNGIDAGALPIE